MKVPNSVEEKFLTKIFSPVFLFSKNPAKFSLVSRPSPPPSFDCLHSMQKQREHAFKSWRWERPGNEAGKVKILLT